MTDKKHIHIVSFDIPFPPKYGGVIDVFYKIKSLHQLGYDISLHCFQYNKKEQQTDELQKYCREVFYYPRKGVYKTFFNINPYIVSSRKNQDLLDNLLKDNDTILFEGLHTCSYLGHPSLRERNKIVWMHNVEWDYYQHLSKADKNFIHKIHFSVESKKLKMFESILQYATSIFSLNMRDAKYMKQYCKQSYFIPSFHSNEEVRSKKGKGKYLLYHGSLNVLENHQAVVFLIKSVFAKVNYPIIIAGKKPRKSLIDLIKKMPHIKLKADLPQDEMNDLIENAHCNVLYTFQQSGIKHKLLNAVYRGRFIIANKKMVLKSGLDSLVILRNEPEKILEEIKSVLETEFTESDIKKRKEVLSKDYNNVENAKILAKHL